MIDTGVLCVWFIFVFFKKTVFPSLCAVLNLTSSPQHVNCSSLRFPWISHVTACLRATVFHIPCSRMIELYFGNCSVKYMYLFWTMTHF